MMKEEGSGGNMIRRGEGLKRLERWVFLVQIKEGTSFRTLGFCQRGLQHIVHKASK